MKKVPGGPAFPEVRILAGDNYNPPTKVYYGGMDLRDYFAAKAMQSILTSCYEDTPEHDEVSVATIAYAMADAMIKERNKPQ